MNRIAKAAEQLSGKSRGRDKMRLDEVLRLYPDGVTLNWLDERELNGNDYIIFTFTEDPNVFSSGSGDFLKLWDLLLKEFDGSISDMQEYLAANPTRIKIWKATTKNRKTYTCVSVIQDDTLDNRGRPDTGGASEIQSSMLPAESQS